MSDISLEQVAEIICETVEETMEDLKPIIRLALEISQLLQGDSGVTITNTPTYGARHLAETTLEGEILSKIRAKANA
jgi:hypothetical protein